MTPLLEVRGLHTRYGRVEALGDAVVPEWLAESWALRDGDPHPTSRSAATRRRRDGRRRR